MTPIGSALVSSGSGFGLGTSLSQQVQDETDEERKKRLAAQQASKLLPSASDAAGFTAAGRALFGI